MVKSVKPFSEHRGEPTLLSDCPFRLFALLILAVNRHGSVLLFAEVVASLLPSLP